MRYSLGSRQTALRDRAWICETTNTTVLKLTDILLQLMFPQQCCWTLNILGCDVTFWRIIVHWYTSAGMILWNGKNYVPHDRRSHTRLGSSTTPLWDAQISQTYIKLLQLATFICNTELDGCTESFTSVSSGWEAIWQTCTKMFKFVLWTW